MYLPENIQKALRDTNKITQNEVLIKEGDLYIAVDVITQKRRVTTCDSKLIESLSNSKSSKQLLKG